MAAINAAWELIGDPAKRAAFDASAPSCAADARRGRASARRRARPRRRRTPPAPGGRRGRRRRPAARRRCRATGRRAARRRAAATTPRCAPPTGSARPGRRPGNPSGSVLNFGRYAGWSLGEIARSDIEYIEWLDRMPIGRPYRDEIDVDPAHGRPARVRGRRGGRPARPVPAPLGRRSPLERGRRRAGSRRRGRSAPSDRATTSQPIVVPCTSSVNSTTPKVISWSRPAAGGPRGAPGPSRPRRPRAARPRTGHGASRRRPRAPRPGRRAQPRRPPSRT